MNSYRCKTKPLQSNYFFIVFWIIQTIQFHSKIYSGVHSSFEKQPFIKISDIFKQIFEAFYMKKTKLSLKMLKDITNKSELVIINPFHTK